MTTPRLFVGSYTRPAGHVPRPQGEGIYTLTFDPVSGQLGEARLVARAVNPSFVALHPDGRSLYAVSEVEAGEALAYRVHPDGALTPLGRRPTRGASPAHLCVEPSGRLVLAANYGAGASAVAFALAVDGDLGGPVAVVQHAPPAHPGAPHAHQVLVSPDGTRAYVTDLGTDEVVTYDLRPGRELRRLGHLRLPTGSGPRHLRFGPSGLAFLVLELHSAVATLRHDTGTGHLSLLSTASTVPPDFQGANWPAEVLVGPDGRQVYVTNRGHDSVAVFGVGAGGDLVLVECAPTAGRTPRGAAWSPGGTHLFCANQDSSSITVFRRDPATGRLQVVGTFPCPTPTSVACWPAQVRAD